MLPYRAAPSIADLIGKAPIKTLAIAFVAGEGRDRQRPGSPQRWSERDSNRWFRLENEILREELARGEKIMRYVS